MRTLVWDSSFRRAFKRAVRKNPKLEERIFEILEWLVDDTERGTREKAKNL